MLIKLNYALYFFCTEKFYNVLRLKVGEILSTAGKKKQYVAGLQNNLFSTGNEPTKSKVFLF